MRADFVPEELVPIAAARALSCVDLRLASQCRDLGGAIHLVQWGVLEGYGWYERSADSDSLDCLL